MGERESGDKTVADCVHENTIRRYWIRLHLVGINLRLPVTGGFPRSSAILAIATIL